MNYSIKKNSMSWIKYLALNREKKKNKAREMHYLKVYTTNLKLNVCDILFILLYLQGSNT
jgi:hypothetical protein